jgi:hypothetical protein
MIRTFELLRFCSSHDVSTIVGVSGFAAGAVEADALATGLILPIAIARPRASRPASRRWRELDLVIMEILSVKKSPISLGFRIMTIQVGFIIISKSSVLQLGRQKMPQKGGVLSELGNAGGGNVELQLRLYRFEAFKLALAAQEVLERDRHSFAVQIAIEIKQVGFQQ